MTKVCGRVDLKNNVLETLRISGSENLHLFCSGSATVRGGGEEESPRTGEGAGDKDDTSVKFR